jgi:hypothetical protein
MRNASVRDLYLGFHGQTAARPGQRAWTEGRRRGPLALDAASGRPGEVENVALRQPGARMAAEDAPSER